MDEAQAKEKTLQHGTPPRIHSYQDVDRGPAALLPDIFSIEMEEELTPPVPGSPVDQPPPQAVTLPSQQPPRFFAQMYCRSAIFLMMSEFRRLHKLYKLDPFKVYAFMYVGQLACALRWLLSGKETLLLYLPSWG